MRKWILKNFQSPGDILMLTAAVRDLHRAFPNAFLTDVRTSCPQLWENNPQITPLSEADPEAEQIHCQYPLVHQSNQSPYHFIHGFIDFLNQRLDGRIRPTRFAGDIHLSPAELSEPSPVAGLIGKEIPYWLIVSGGKYDCTIKWWHFRRYQAVVDHFRERLLFVQVGEKGHFHPDLAGVLDFRGKTDTRALIRLMHHAQGVVCGVTFLMHLAAAVPLRDRPGQARPCVVIAGGREPPQWEAYPTQQFIHTVGALPCCASGGCWRARTVPLGDGDSKDLPGALCQDVVDCLPRCMSLITPEEVIRRINLHFDGKLCRHLTSNEACASRPFLTSSLRQLLNLEARP